jgi:hypothetical protein
MNKLQIYTIGILLFCLSSCSSLYLPSIAPPPMVKNKNDLNVGGTMAINGINLHGAYAPINNLGIFANTQGFVSTNTKNISAEVGIGYCPNVGDGIWIDFYGGAGYGHSQTGVDFIIGTSNGAIGNYAKVFIQPNFGISRNDFDLMITPRVTRVFMTSNYLNYESNVSFAEPTVTMNFGKESNKIALYAGFSAPIDNYTFNWRPLICGLGIKHQFNYKK